MVSEVFEEIQASLSAVSARDNVEVRALTDKLTSAIPNFLDTLKEGTSLARTDLVMGVGSFKADAVEESQKAGMELQGLEARLTVDLGAVRTDSENVKLRSVWTYSVVLCMACILFAAQAKAPKKTAKPVPGYNPEETLE